MVAFPLSIWFLSMVQGYGMTHFVGLFTMVISQGTGAPTARLSNMVGSIPVKSLTATPAMSTPKTIAARNISKSWQTTTMKRRGLSSARRRAEPWGKILVGWLDGWLVKGGW